MKRLNPLFFLFLSLGAGAQENGLMILCELDRPAQYQDDNGVLRGFTVEIVQEIQRRVGNDDPIRMVNWENGINLTATGNPGIFLFTTNRTLARETKFHWVGPLTESVSGLYVHKNYPMDSITTEQAKGMRRIGVYRGDSREDLLKKMGFQNLDSAPNSELNLKKFLEGRVEAVAASSLTFGEKLRGMGRNPDQFKVVLEFSRIQGYLAVSKGTDLETVRKWQKALDDIRSEGLMKAIYDNYIPGTPLPGPGLPPQ